MSEKTEIQKLQEQLTFKTTAATPTEAEMQTIQEFNEGYKIFLNNSKTEGLCVETVIKMAQDKGYVEFTPGTKYNAGAKVYVKNRGAAIMLATIGSKSPSEGLRIIASHIDSPRLDLKPNPLYEENEIAYMKTHYYGGVRKYQWPTIPLALHGVVYKADGEMVRISIGEDENDPLFYITDLLPHIAKEQNGKTLGQAFHGESMNLIIGSLPYNDKDISEKTKFTVLKLLHDKYGITEADFRTADIKAVPAYKARDIGLDRALVASYGHDDRVCAYTSLIAEFNTTNPAHTTVTILADKEEVGSMGNTGLDSHYFVNFAEELADAAGVKLRHVLSASKALSADVNAAYDPAFASVYDKRNNSFLHHGVGIAKYVGSGGKGGTVDASAEYLSFLRRMLDGAGIKWQLAGFGRIDEGGGGTVAKFLARYDMDIVDIGVPVLSMHAPYEVVSKIDVYMTFRAFEEFYNN